MVELAYRLALLTPIASQRMAWGRSAAAVALVVVLAGCGDDDDSSTTAAIQSTVSTATSTSAPAASPACGGIPEFDLEADLRPQFVDYLVSCGFTDDEAGCLFDNLDYADPDVAAGRPEAIEAAFETCRIDPARMAEIGGS